MSTNFSFTTPDAVREKLVEKLVDKDEQHDVLLYDFFLCVTVYLSKGIPNKHFE